MHTLDNVFFYNMLCFGFVLNVFLCFVHLSQNAVLHFPLKWIYQNLRMFFFSCFDIKEYIWKLSVFACMHNSTSISSLFHI